MICAVRPGRKSFRGSRLPRRFIGNLFGPEEEIDPNDPGRVGVCKEYQSMPGTVVAAEESEFGWAVALLTSRILISETSRQEP